MNMDVCVHVCTCVTLNVIYSILFLAQCHFSGFNLDSVTVLIQVGPLMVFDIPEAIPEDSTLNKSTDPESMFSPIWSH